MRYSHSLRTRVATAFAALGGGLSLVIAIGLHIGAKDAGERLIDETLDAEMQDYYTRRIVNPRSRPPATITLLGYVTPARANDPALPVELKVQQPGHQHILLHGIPYRLAIVDQQGSRYYMLFNEAPLQKRLFLLSIFLAGFVCLMMLFSGGLAFWLADRVIEPVKELARRLRDIGPDTPHANLAADFPQDELGELARAFEQSLDRLAAFIEREHAFTADVSHELRTPLAAIRGAAEVMLADASRPEKDRQRLQRIERAATDMADLSTALLAMAREHDDGRRHEAIDLAALLLVALEKHQYLLHGKSVEVILEIQARPTLVADPNLLAIVIANLLRNSFCYTEAGTVTLRLEAARLSVRDTGLGIPREALNQVFQRLYKGQHSLGAGIGLALVKKICDRYGWRIELESTEGRGTEAVLSFSRAD